MNPEIILILHNIRSTHNVGAIFRSAEGFGVRKIILSGYTPYPSLEILSLRDPRLPHIAEKLTAQIHKTALGAETLVPFEYRETPNLDELRADGYRVVALEQAVNSISLPRYQAPGKVVLLLGEEVHGVPAELLAQADDIVEIPMFGQKESFNVSVACGVALYGLKCG